VGISAFLTKWKLVYYKL